MAFCSLWHIYGYLLSLKLICLPSSKYPISFSNLAIVDLSYPIDKTLPTVPVKALIFDKSKYFIMIYKSKCEIETREVEVFKTNANWAYITHGVNVGEKVVVRNQLFIYDELND